MPDTVVRSGVTSGVVGEAAEVAVDGYGRGYDPAGAAVAAMLRFVPRQAGGAYEQWR